MEIGSSVIIMEYTDKDVLGNNLTVDTAVRYNPIFKKSNCLTLGTSDYVELDASVKNDVKKVSFWYKQITTGTTDILSCIGLLNGVSWGVVQSGISTDLLIANNDISSFYRFSNSKVISDSKWHFVEIIAGVTFETFMVKVDNTLMSYVSNGSNNNHLNSYTGVGTRQHYTKRPFSICDLKLYNSSDELIHHYPMAEGAGFYVYDAIELSAGSLTCTDVDNCWENKQDFFHYNITNGFVKDFPAQIKDLEITTYTDALVPNEEILVGKFSSKLSGLSKLGCTINSYNYDYESDTLTFNITANPTTLYSDARIQFGVGNFTPVTMAYTNFKGKTYRAVFDYEITNIVNDQGLTTFSEMFGTNCLACYASIWTSGTGHALNYFSTTETSCDSIRAAFQNFNSGNLIYFVFYTSAALRESSADFSFTFKVSNFRLYLTTQVYDEYSWVDDISAFEQNPVVINLHNLCETILDY